MKFELNEYHRGVSDEELIADLKRVASKLNKETVSTVDYEEKGKFGKTTYLRKFGSWFKALEKAGLQKTRTQANVPDEELFSNLEEIWIKMGRQPNYDEIQKPLSKYHVGTYENRFGTWRKALERFVRYTKEEDVESTPVTKQYTPKGSHKTKRNINLRMRFITIRRDNFKCRSCGKSPATDSRIILHVDHIKAWSKGGETAPENLQTLCSECNIGKSDI